MDRASQTELAWALATAAGSRLTGHKRHEVYIAIGSGDVFVATCALITVIADAHIGLTGGLIDLCRQWLDSYADCDNRFALRSKVDQIPTIYPSPTVAAPERLTIAKRYTPGKT